MIVSWISAFLGTFCGLHKSTIDQLYGPLGLKKNECALLASCSSNQFFTCFQLRSQFPARSCALLESIVVLLECDSMGFFSALPSFLFSGCYKDGSMDAVWMRVEGEYFHI